MRDRRCPRPVARLQHAGLAEGLRGTTRRDPGHPAARSSPADRHADLALNFEVDLRSRVEAHTVWVARGGSATDGGPCVPLPEPTDYGDDHACWHTRMR